MTPLRLLLLSRNVKVKDVAKVLRYTPEAMSKKLRRNYLLIEDIIKLKNTYSFTPDEILKIFF